MKILYTTNPNAEDINEIPNFIRSFGDEVVVKTQRFELEYLKDEKIDFIVSNYSNIYHLVWLPLLSTIIISTIIPPLVRESLRVRV